MKYTPELTQKLVEDYAARVPIEDIASSLGVPARSVIAKLSSLGLYHKKSYTNKRGEVPVSKSEMIVNLAALLNTNTEVLESLEKTNKNVLKLLILNLQKP